MRVQFVTDDGAVILLHYTGLVERTAAFNAAAEAGGETDWGDQGHAHGNEFRDGRRNYAWLNESLFVAEGRLAGPAEIEYRVYRVV